MNYLQHNKVNYTTVSSNDNIIGYSNDDIYINSSNYILSVNNNTIDNIVHDNNKATIYYTTVTTNTKILQYTNTRFCNTLMYNIILSFTSSDFTAITSNDTSNDTIDTITFDIAINDNVYTYTYTVQPLFMNMYDLFNTIPVNDTIKSFTITASSTTPLTVFNMNKTHNGHKPCNCFILL